MRDRMSTFTIVYLSADHVSDDKVVYHGKWKIDDKEGFSIFSGSYVASAFKGIQHVCYLDAKNAVYDFVPFGKYKGMEVEKAPKEFVERWAKKKIFSHDDEKTIRFVEKCIEVLD